MILLTPAVLESIRSHGEAAYPEECCGALLGWVASNRRAVTAALALVNAAEVAKERRFRIAPQEYRRAEDMAAARGLVLVGFYHSHPDHQARPSAYDLEQALPWHSYVILAVPRGRAAEWRAWILAADRSRFELEPGAAALPEA